MRSLANLFPAPVRVVFANFGWLAMGEVMCRGISLVAAGFYARKLAPEMFGYLALSMAVVSYVGLLITLGIDPVVVREIARTPEQTACYASRVLTLRLLLAGIAYAVLAALVAALPFPALLKRLLWVDGLGLLPLAAGVSWAFQGLQQMRSIAVVRTGQSALGAALIVWLVHGPEGVVLVAWSNLLASIAAALCLLILLARSVGRFTFALDREFTFGLLRRAAPFALAMVASQIYCRSGLVMLGWWHPAAEVGLFGSAYRLTYGMLQTMAGLLLVAFVPALSRAYAHSPRELRSLHRRYNAFSWLCAGGTLIAFALFPAFVLRLCFGAAYEPAAPVLRLLACCVAASFVSGPYVAAMMATRFERVLLWQTWAFGALCLLLNVLLIPRRGGEGAALALLVSILAGTASSIYFYHRCIAGSGALPLPAHAAGRIVSYES